MTFVKNRNHEKATSFIIGFEPHIIVRYPLFWPILSTSYTRRWKVLQH